jgi:uncharacterized protein involved in propanediol utilization
VGEPLGQTDTIAELITTIVSRRHGYSAWSNSSLVLFSHGPSRPMVRAVRGDLRLLKARQCRNPVSDERHRSEPRFFPATGVAKEVTVIAVGDFSSGSDETPADKLATGSGIGRAIAHHGELIQGVFEDDHGRLHRALVTLPLVRLRSQATFTKEGGADVGVTPQHRTKAAQAARLTLAHLGHPGATGALSIASSIPIGHGYGSSTADVVASIRAVSAAHGVKLRPSTVCRIAVAAEQASDAVAYEDHAVLFAQREGIVLEEFGGSVPPLLVVGFKANGGEPIDTLRLAPARYGSEEIQLFRVVRGLMSRAIRFQDPSLLGRAATISAQVSQRHLPKQHFDIALDIANRNGACGVQVAHSGSLIGIMLDLSQKEARHKATAIAAAVDAIGFNDVQLHHVNDEACEG